MMNNIAGLAYGLPAPLDTWPGLVGAATGLSIVTWWALFPLCRTLEDWGLIDIPNERSLHAKPIPRGGGLAIVSCVLLSLCALAFAGHDLWVAMRAYVTAAALVAALGWADDRWSLPVSLRLLGQLGVAVAFVMMTGPLRSLWVPGIGPVASGWWSMAIAVVWIVGLTNAYNFMDGIDGLAAGQAVIAGICWFMIGRHVGQEMVAAIGLLVAAGSWAFLPHNWPPARVFLGDVGSCFLGFSFAALPLIAQSNEPAAGASWLVIGALPLSPFLFDTTLTFVRRLIRGENVFRAHRSHLYQRLATVGWSPAHVTLLYLVLTLPSATAAYFVAAERPVPVRAAMTLAVACLLGLAASTTLSERRQKSS